MNALNSLLLEGNIINKPEIQETPRGSKLCNFTIASYRFFRQDDVEEKEESFFEVETWGSLAVNIV